MSQSSACNRSQIRGLDLRIRSRHRDKCDWTRTFETHLPVPRPSETTPSESPDGQRRYCWEEALMDLLGLPIADLDGIWIAGCKEEDNNSAQDVDVGLR